MFPKMIVLSQYGVKRYMNDVYGSSNSDVSRKICPNVHGKDAMNQTARREDDTGFSPDQSDDCSDTWWQR